MRFYPSAIMGRGGIHAEKVTWDELSIPPKDRSKVRHEAVHVGKRSFIGERGAKKAV